MISCMVLGDVEIGFLNIFYFVVKILKVFFIICFVLESL